ncbi:MAG TPA: AAA family ATPase [Candidatus Nanopelagicales bacterium]|nr:AAA family ATPase [Candidatus Nanopelagicales bacterium]
MKIKKFWAKGYRSLRDVTLEPLTDFNVFYGQNGSGKSNVLDALQTLFYVMPLAVDSAYGPEEDRLSFREAGRQAATWIREDDFYAREDTQVIELGAVIEDPAADAQFRGHPVRRVEIAIRFSRVRPGQFNLQFTRLYINYERPGLPFADPVIREILRGIVPQAFTHLGVTRTLSVTAPLDGVPPSARVVGTIPDGEVVRELFRAKNARDREVRERFDRLREFMAKVLHRGEFDVFMDPETGSLELREMLPEPNPLRLDVRVEHAGHGVVQMYSIVATILLAGGRLVALEEPEAHLHAPTLGRELRSILRRMVDDGQVHQLFIATHSNLFDLDPTGYWDVSLLDGETRIVRKPLDEIDRLHLVEPGPAKHQLQEMLRLYGDEVVFKAADGRRLTAQEMLVSLQQDDDVAMAFLDALHAAAMQVTGLRAKRARDASNHEPT